MTKRLTTERLTQAQLEAIRKRAEAATKGPWYWENAAELRSKENVILEAAEGAPGDIWIDAWNRDEEFIAHSREDIPALLAEVERMRTTIEFYAHKSTWENGEYCTPEGDRYVNAPPFIDDMGDKAREAIRNDRE